MRLLTVAVVLLVIASVLLVSECEAKKKAKNNKQNNKQNKGGNNGKHLGWLKKKNRKNKHHVALPVAPVVPRFPAMAEPCWTAFSNGTVIDAGCPTGECIRGPYEGTMADNTSAIVKFCTGRLFPPCRVIFQNGTEIHPVICESSCANPKTYLLDDGTHLTAYTCRGDPDPYHRPPCFINYGNYTEQPVTCPQGTSCVVGPFGMTMRDGTVIDIMRCNSTDDFEHDEHFDLPPTCWTRPLNNDSMDCPMANMTCPNHNVTCSNQTFNLTRPDGVVLAQEVCCCHRSAPPTPPCWQRYENGTAYTRNSFMCPPESSCSVGPYQVWLPDGEKIKMYSCTKPPPPPS